MSIQSWNTASCMVKLQPDFQRPRCSVDLLYLREVFIETGTDCPASTTSLIIPFTRAMCKWETQCVHASDTSISSPCWKLQISKGYILRRFNVCRWTGFCVVLCMINLSGCMCWFLRGILSVSRRIVPGWDHVSPSHVSSLLHLVWHTREKVTTTFWNELTTLHYLQRRYN